MKELFTPEHFFDLSQYTHKKLFYELKFVWKVFDRISSYLKTETLGVQQGNVSKQAYLVNPDQISIGIGTVVEPGAYIKGPCIIGNYCTIRHGAYLRGQVITGDHCVIGHATEVKNSILLDHAQASHFSYVGDSILGNRTNLGAGVKLANLLFSNKSIQIAFEGLELNTGLRKLGAIVGDQGQIGCNSVTNPGTFMGRRSCIYPCMNAGGVVLEDQVLKSTNETISYPQKSYALS